MWWSYSMRKTLMMLALLVGALIFGNTVGSAAPIAGSGDTIYGTAPIGHLQPRPEQYSPQSQPEQAEQQQMSIFDARQQKQDDELDKRLNICRGC
jgi:hypothetical protein